MAISITAPLTREQASNLKAGDSCLISGVIYTAKEGQAIGSAGPTTSYRMDAYSPTLIAQGQTGMIGKGKREPEVIEAMKEHGAVYFGAIRRLEVEDFPAIVIIDSEGNNLYETGREAYLATV